ncbi:MAG: hypothetical protein ACE5FN_10625 [Leptospirillia bacterium]
MTLLLGGVGIASASSAGDDGYPKVGLHAYTQAHAQNPNPPDRFGGRVIISGKQKGGAAQFILPGPRQMDPAVFGTPEHPTGWDQAPFPLIGIPAGMRQTRDGAFTIVDHATPFSDWRVIGTGDLELKLEDKTAIDGAATKDKVHFVAEFDAPDGTHHYRIEADEPLPHGFGYPTFGGVVTDHLMHGVTGIGTRLMPTEYALFSFWAKGRVFVDDRLTNDNHIIHVMLTESVRGKGYRLNHDGVSDGSGQVLHLMVPPYKVGPNGPEKSPLRSGYIPFPQVKAAMTKDMARIEKMPDGPDKATAMADMKAAKELMAHTKEHVQEAMAAGKMFGMPFFHVMFGNVDYKVKTKRK